MRAPPGANSPDIIVDVRVMHALHLRVVGVYACVLLRPERESVGGSAWRQRGGVQRSRTVEESLAGEGESARRKVKKITRILIVEATSDGGDVEGRRYSYRVHQRRPLIKSLLNRVTALPLAEHVAVNP